MKQIATRPAQGQWQGQLDQGMDPSHRQGEASADTSAAPHHICPPHPTPPPPPASPQDSESGCWGRNALGFCEDKIKSLWGVSRQHSRKRDSTVCFLGGLSVGFFFNFILFYFIFGSCDGSRGGVNGLAPARMHLWLSRGKSGWSRSLCAAEGMSHSQAGRGEEREVLQTQRGAGMEERVLG